VVTVDGRRVGRTFEGIGAVSAGASSRLLIEYPEPYRSQVLDYLFKPNYGAGFQHLKVEIGGDVNSTDGCEPSHQHTRREENYQRGYEWWLMQEAKRRNRGICLEALEWGAPAWLGSGYFNTQDNADYIARFIKGAKTVHGLEVDYTGIWNETRADMGFVKLLRQTLDRNGLGRVQIVAAEDINRWSFVEVMKTDPELAKAVQIVGVHYPKYNSTTAARICGKRLWASEDGPWKGNWVGACALAKLYNRNYIGGKMTKTIIWSPVTSYYDNLPLPGSGVLRANAPWSGYYEVQPALWATAHTTQFAKPGWLYLEDGCGLLPGGSYVSLKSPTGNDLSIIVETIDADEPQALTFDLAGGLFEQALVHIWRSCATEQFVKLGQLQAQGGRIALVLEPGCIYSLTTTTGQTKGAATSPAPAQFPVPYAEDFERYSPGATPKYFADQAGSFEVAEKSKGKGQCLRQLLDQKGIEWPFHLNPFPETFLGNPNWCDYALSTEALLEGPGFVSLFGRVGIIPQNANAPNAYWLKVDQAGYWELGTCSHALASGRVPFSVNTWHKLKLRFAGATIQAFIDEKQVTEVTDGTYSCGMAGVGCGWHRAQFDNLSIEPDPADKNLAFAKPAAASSFADADTTPERATDGDAFTTRWSAANGKTSGEWLEIALGAGTTFSAVTLKQSEDRITGFKIQYSHGTDWQDAFIGGNLGTAPKKVSFSPVTANRVRCYVTEAKAPPSLWELEVRRQ
jgi:galactosylceramidase